LKISKEGLDLIKKYEGFRNHPYLCSANVPTIGYGNTYYPNGNKVTLNDPPITKQRAEELLLIIVASFEKGVNRLVKSSINQNQFDALVSFAYNLGVTALSTSTLLKKVNVNPNDPSIKNEFKKWVNAGGKRLKGLVRRRNEEAFLYFK